MIHVRIIKNKDCSDYNTYLRLNKMNSARWSYLMNKLRRIETGPESDNLDSEITVHCIFFFFAFLLFSVELNKNLMAQTLIYYSNNAYLINFVDICLGYVIANKSRIKKIKRKSKHTSFLFNRHFCLSCTWTFGWSCLSALRNSINTTFARICNKNPKAKNSFYFIYLFFLKKEENPKIYLKNWVSPKNPSTKSLELTLLRIYWYIFNSELPIKKNFFFLFVQIQKQEKI